MGFFLEAENRRAPSMETPRSNARFRLGQLFCSSFRKLTVFSDPNESDQLLLLSFSVLELLFRSDQWDSARRMAFNLGIVDILLICLSHKTEREICDGVVEGRW